MTLPFFFVGDLNAETIVLDEDTSKHISVLRMQKGEQILLTDGKGKKALANVIDDNRKKCVVEISSIQIEEERKRKVAIGISLIKNTSRFEWFLEKATEIGVSEIIPLICERTEKQHFRLDRMKNILVSAMLQSQQAWLPVLHEPVEFSNVIKNVSQQNKFIAHCDEGERKNLSNILNDKKEVANSQVLPLGENLGGAIIFIGPEGDFTKEEVELAIKNNFIPVSLGDTRLRTETAGIVACVLLNQ